MAEHLIQIEEARENLLACAAYLAKNIKSSDGYAEAMKEIVPRYLEKKKVDLAAQLADSIADPFTRDRLLSDVAEKCAAIDDDDYAFQLIESIEDVALQGEAKERIAVKKAAAGEFDKAFEIAAALVEPSHAFGIIAYHLTAANRETEAGKMLAAIEYPAAKVNALQSIAEYYERENQIEKAVETLDEAVLNAEETDFAEEKIRILQNIAEHYAKNNRKDKAIEIFDRAKTEAEKLDNNYRDIFLSTIAGGFLRAGSLELADRTLDGVKDKTQIAACLLGFAREFTRKGETSEALETLEEAYAVLKSQRDREIRDSRARFGLLASVAVQFAGIDKPERAIEIAQSITDETEQTSALSQIAQVSTTLKKDETARLSINAIREDSRRMFALINVSDEKRKQGKAEESIEILNEAAHLAETVPQLSARSAAYNELAKRFYEYAEIEKARSVSRENLETIAQIRDETTRAVALAKLNDFYEQADFQLTEPEKTIISTLTRRSEW
ncbi:MAG TPA: hypothetical protein VNI84_07560 [Pyrinomonadaceae bacterium]|nr:hypothetical protein [Pyrinomonadaceae bacterium]